MGVKKGQCLGGIRTLEDLKAQCVIEGSCWHLRTRQGLPLPANPNHDVWLHGIGLVSFRRAAWYLKHGHFPERPLCVVGTCDSHDCCNPAHAAPMTRKEWGAQLRARGTLRGDPGRILVNRAINEKRRKLSDEQHLEIATCDRPAHELAAELGVSRSLIQRIKKGRVYRPRAPIATSVFAWRPA